MKAINSKNEGKPSLKDVIKSKINIKAGEMTFGQRIEVGKIIETESDGIVQAISIMQCLHNFRPNYKQLLKLQPYLVEISDGFKFWIDTEATLLKYDPTIEEKQAGIKELAEKTGELGTVKAMAKAFSKDPDEILLWKYGKVFGILLSDLEECKFNRRYDKVIEAKYKHS